MKNSKKFFYLILSVLFFGILFLPGKKCFAESATITLSTDTQKPQVGDDIIVYLTISSDVKLGDFVAYITYDADVLEFKTDASFIAGGEGLLKLTDKNPAGQDTSRKYAIKFKAKTIGVSEIAIKDKPEVYEAESGNDMSVSSNSIKIEVKAAKSASDNANLKSLKVSPGKLSPDFDKDVTKYTVDLKYEDERIVISAVPEDENANVTIDGNEKLSVGNNKLRIKVKAESGHIKEYTITAVRQDKGTEDTKETNDGDTLDDNDKSKEEYNNKGDNFAQIGKLVLIREGDDLYIQNGYRYRVLEPTEEVQIPDGFTETSLILDSQKVTAFTPSDDLDSDFLLLYVMNENGETGFYQYDRKEETLQRYVKAAGEGGKVVMPEELIRSEEYKDKLISMGILAGVLGSVCILLSVALIRVYLKKKDDKEDIGEQ
ncbi:MAG: Cadherin-like domain-containing protein [Lachnoclostridium sp.]|jgi:hypothetical protein